MVRKQKIGEQSKRRTFGDTIRNSSCQPRLAYDGAFLGDATVRRNVCGGVGGGELAAALAGSLDQAELPHRVAYGVPGSDLRIRQPCGQLRMAPQEPPVATERRLHSRAVCSSSGK